MRNLKWIKEDKKYFLKNDEVTLVDLTINLVGISTFSVDNKQYRVVKKGFLSPVYIVQSHGEYILKLSHSFWGSNGRIIFNDGSVYACNYKNKGGLKMRFMDGDNEILSYCRNIENKKTVPTFSVGISIVDAEKLLLLAALGLIMFQCMFREDTTDDGGSLLLMVAAAS